MRAEDAGTYGGSQLDSLNDLLNLLVLFACQFLQTKLAAKANICTVEGAVTARIEGGFAGVAYEEWFRVPDALIQSCKAWFVASNSRSISCANSSAGSLYSRNGNGSGKKEQDRANRDMQRFFETLLMVSMGEALARLASNTVPGGSAVEAVSASRDESTDDTDDTGEPTEGAVDDGDNGVDGDDGDDDADGDVDGNGEIIDEGIDTDASASVHHPESENAGRKIFTGEAQCVFLRALKTLPSSFSRENIRFKDLMLRRVKQAIEKYLMGVAIESELLDVLKKG
jgi:hypothetical protein